ncbi:MAG: chorismate synthase [Lachnospiraceae bacterium]|nr:chorismate synthase [Lachnospiraceae bacterium]
MSGSVFGTNFRVSTFGESHGEAIGVVIDGCPAGLELTEKDIQIMLDRRKPSNSQYSTKRKEADKAVFLSGIFEGVTTGTPIAIVIYNQDQRSKDYSDIANCFRPGHADYTFDAKFGIRDYRGGGRSSGRETAARVAAGAVAKKILEKMGISFTTYANSIGPISVEHDRFDINEIMNNPLFMPDPIAAEDAMEYLDSCIEKGDSVGGVVECIIKGVPAGVGEPVFDKLDARLAYAIMSIGAVKGFEVGDGFLASLNPGSVNNDQFECVSGTIYKKTNHAGGILGGISDGSDIVFRAAIKPTPSISMEQHTVNKDGENITLSIKGRHDPVIVPRAVVVVEAMAAIALVDLIFEGKNSRI